MIVSLGLLVIIGLGAGAVYLFKDLPPVETLKTYEPAQATRIYSDDKRLIAQFFLERREFVPLSKIPRHMIRAILAVEDARFYQHGGFDWIRIVKAALTNLGNLQVRQGASTITQQVVRSLFLTPERTMERKLKEALLAHRMEIVFTKDEILEIYFNQIYFGHGAYGIQAAARTYFGKDVGKITIGESAFIAGLPKAPNSYSPYYYPENAKRRQGIVLKRMRDEKFITEEQYQKIYKQELLFQEQGEEDALAPHFLEHVRQELLARYGYNKVYKGGLNVYTTLNIDMQKYANRAVHEGLRELDKRQGYRGPIKGKKAKVKSPPMVPGAILDGRVISLSGKTAKVESDGIIGDLPLDRALWARRQKIGSKEAVWIDEPTLSDIVRPGDRIRVRVERNDRKALIFSLEQEPAAEVALLALDPATGRVKALVGGYDFKRSKFDRALLARRQPGSAFKPMVYAAALERGLTAATVVVDNPVVFSSGGRVWKPENYAGKFYGPTRLRDGLTFSRNLATVKLLQRVGIGRVIEFAQRIGVRSPLQRNLSLALGTSEVSLLEITSAYGVMANQGVRVEPSFIVSVEDRTGQVLESHSPALKRVMARETAYVITNMMEDVIQRGTARKALVLGRPLAGKTGTTNDFTDAWFIGYSPQLVAGVWVGFDDHRSLGDDESGGAAALPIWVTFMDRALERYPETPFRIPEGIVYARIDPKSGLRVSEEEPNAMVEVFVKGTVPREYKPETEPPQPARFFKLDEEEF